MTKVRIISLCTGVLVLAASFFLSYIPILGVKASDPLFGMEGKNAKPIRVLFVGDIMLDRYVAHNTAIQGREPFIKEIRSLFENNDFNVANLEGTITDSPSIAQVDHTIFRFTFDKTLAEFILRALSLNVVSLANNHTLDFGVSGYASTRDFLTERDVLFFGSPSNSENLSVQKIVRGKNICFVGYEAFIRPDPVPILAEIQTLKPSCYRIIVFAHWGEEYNPDATDLQRNVAHQFVDSGADLVIGAHPHVVEPVEIYKEKAIFYSLGNFIFDQYFSLATRRGLVVTVEFGRSYTNFTLTPVSIEREGISIAEGEKKSFTIGR